MTPILRYDPLGRLIRTDLPNGTHSRVTFTPWQQASWDGNDTVLEAGNPWYAARQPSATPTPSAQEQRAAELTEEHAETPALVHFDVLGRPVRGVEDNKTAGVYTTKAVLDIEGNPRAIIDARGNTAMVRPGKSGPKGMRCDKLMKFGLPSGGCDPRPAKGGPPRPVASLATVTVTRPAMRRRASVRAVGNAHSAPPGHPFRSTWALSERSDVPRLSPGSWCSWAPSERSDDSTDGSHHPHRSEATTPELIAARDAWLITLRFSLP
ncbi:hypothetical protein [Polyangium fumosum]|uniref:RHS repeat protein n=1 Tax=Polyangium fumosum TaxID=889272 RepID=A0A4U1IL08_9BACT|nr:hypothetical protein [Polyangium fumosum]TKC94644.1 hypothetical protein E8A74_47965 [Polyangium fumosum]